MRSFRRFGTILGVLAAVLFLGGARPASAQTVTFEGLGNGAQITNGYSGLNWDNMFTLDATGIDPSGYKNGIVSGNMVAYNGFANPASFSAGTPFVFNSVYLAGAWRNNLNVLVEGLSNGSVVRSQTVVVSALAPTLFTFNWSGINQVRFSSSGGTSAGFGPSAQQFVMDNLSVTTVPEPASLALALPGVLPLGLMALRRRKLKAPLA